MSKSAARAIFNALPYIAFLYFAIVFTSYTGNSWRYLQAGADSLDLAPMGPPPAPSLGMFQPFSSGDWLGLGMAAVADFADLDSSWAIVKHDQNMMLRYPTIHYRGEGNPLITGLFGTHYPTALDYTAWMAIEIASQALLAWALPESWREGAWGLYVGIGAADTVINSYSGGVVFRF